MSGDAIHDSDKTEKRIEYLSEMVCQMDVFVSRLLVIVASNFPAMDDQLAAHLNAWNKVKADVNQEFNADTLFDDSDS